MKLKSQNTLSHFAEYVANYSMLRSVMKLMICIASFPALHMRGVSKCKNESTDVLFIDLFTTASSGKKLLIDELRIKYKLTVKQHDILSWLTTFILGEFRFPSYPVKPCFLLKAGLANYLMEKYRPKIIIVSSEDTLVPFLRYEANKINAKLINIAHSIIFNTPSFSMCDYDYYFIFGNGSYKSLSENSKRYGSTKIVKTGPLDYFHLNKFSPSMPSPKTVLYCSTWIDPLKSDQVKELNLEIVRLAKERKDWQVKVRLHPLENPRNWNNLAKEINNLEIIYPSVEFLHAVQDSVLVICLSDSTTPLDCSYFDKPLIVLKYPINDLGFYDSYPALLRQPDESIGNAIDRNLSNEFKNKFERQKLIQDNITITAKDNYIEIANNISHLLRGEDIGPVYYLHGSSSWE